VVRLDISRATGWTAAVEPGGALIVFGLALALWSQGAYHWPAQLIVALVLAVGVLFLPRQMTVSRTDLPVVLTAAGLAGWAVVNGVLTSRFAGGVGYGLLIAGVVVLVCACRRLRGRARTHLLGGLITACCLVAALGWFGVVAHHQPLGFVSPGLWRASSTLTYPNATAALLATAALVCLAVRTRAADGRWLGVAATALVAGLAATMSRAGLLAFAVGVVVLLVRIGWRPVGRAALAPLAGAAIAVAGLLPAATADAPTPSTVGLAVGAAVFGLTVGSRRTTTPLLLLVPFAGFAVPGIGNLGSRFTLDSPDRWGSIRSAWQVFAEHPIAGVGPGLDRLLLERAEGGASVFRYAHNEYLQVLAELGAVGGVLLFAVLLAVLRDLHRSRRPTGALGAGVLAGVAALVVHAGFDFVWHIPAVPLCAAVLIGLATPARHAGPCRAITTCSSTENERKN
jgi:hypothetical protein